MRTLIVLGIGGLCFGWAIAADELPPPEATEQWTPLPPVIAVPAADCVSPTTFGTATCAGPEDTTRFTAEPRRGDILVRSAGVQVLVDPRTALYLKGTQLDYSNQLIAGGFKFSNPNAKASCSCGESFSV